MLHALITDTQNDIHAAHSCVPRDSCAGAALSLAQRPYFDSKPCALSCARGALDFDDSMIASILIGKRSRSQKLTKKETKLRTAKHTSTSPNDTRRLSSDVRNDRSCSLLQDGGRLESPSRIKDQRS